MLKTILQGILLTVIVMINVNVEAHRFYSTVQNAYVKLDSWDVVVTDNSIYAPNLYVEERGFENKKYKMEIEWHKVNNQTYDPVYKSEKTILGPNSSSKGYFDINNSFKNAEFHPVNVKIDGVKVDEFLVKANSKFYNDILKSITGQVATKDNYNIEKYGAEEVFFEYKNEIPEYDGYGRIKCYDISHVKYNVYPVFAKINKRIILSKYSSYGVKYYPALNEFFDGLEQTYFNYYEYAKNSSGQWRCKLISGNYDSWRDAESDIIDKLDNLEIKLGL